MRIHSSAPVTLAGAGPTAAVRQGRSEKPRLAEDSQNVSISTLLQSDDTAQASRLTLLAGLEASVRAGDYQCDPDAVASAILESEQFNL